MHSTHRVQFERPNLDQLNQSYTVVDLHFHSHYSDGLNSIDKIAAHARKLGIGIAITDHNDIRGALEIDQHKDLLSIPGIEITTAEGSHLLAYFYDTRQLQRFYNRDVAPNMGADIMSSLRLTMAQVIQRAKVYDCVVIFPHPYCTMYTGVCNLQFSKDELHQLLRKADGVEVINANNLNKWNLKCAVLGFNLGKGMVGGSDGHSLGHMGRAVTYAHCPSNRRDFLNTVRQGVNQVAGKEVDFLSKVTANGLKLRSSLNNCPDLMGKHIRYGCKAIDFKSRSIRSNMRRRFNKRINSQTLRNYFGN